jgi:demethylmenaquinone methyltransferase / 2-methoxy-6-polyprenyl-1,4-benzoquinol methylase
VTPRPSPQESLSEQPGASRTAPGSRPEGTFDEMQARARVREMFTRIAPTYDFLNLLLSLSLDRLWRRRAAKRFSSILGRPGTSAADLCCGTGELSFALSRRSAKLSNTSGPHCRVLGLDFALPMVELASRKGRRGRIPVPFLAGDALSLPFAASSFDLVTAGFGFRNLANYERGLEEIARVLKPGGEVGILDFSENLKGLGAAAFRAYFRHVLPRIGRAISADAKAYAYLPKSVSKFPGPEELARWMERAGFADVKFELWIFGGVALHIGRKP